MSRRRKFKMLMKEIFGWGTFFSVVTFVMCAIWGAPAILIRSTLTLIIVCGLITLGCVE